MSEEIPQEIVELRKDVILEYMKSVPLIIARTYERFTRVGVTFSDEQKEAIQEDISEAKEQE